MENQIETELINRLSKIERFFSLVLKKNMFPSDKDDMIDIVNESKNYRFHLEQNQKYMKINIKAMIETVTQIEQEMIRMVKDNKRLFELS